MIMSHFDEQRDNNKKQTETVKQFDVQLQMIFRNKRFMRGGQHNVVFKTDRKTAVKKLRILLRFRDDVAARILT